MISCLALGCGLNPCLVGRESPVSISCCTAFARPKSYSDSENSSRYFTNKSDKSPLCLFVKDLSLPPTRSTMNCSLPGVSADGDDVTPDVTGDVSSGVTLTVSMLFMHVPAGR